MAWDVPVNDGAPPGVPPVQQSRAASFDMPTGWQAHDHVSDSAQSNDCYAPSDPGGSSDWHAHASSDSYKQTRPPASAPLPSVPLPPIDSHTPQTGIRGAMRQAKQLYANLRRASIDDDDDAKRRMPQYWRARNVSDTSASERSSIDEDMRRMRRLASPSSPTADSFSLRSTSSGSIPPEVYLYGPAQLSRTDSTESRRSVASGNSGTPSQRSAAEEEDEEHEAPPLPPIPPEPAELKKTLLLRARSKSVDQLQRLFNIPRTSKEQRPKRSGTRMFPDRRRREKSDAQQQRKSPQLEPLAELPEGGERPREEHNSASVHAAGRDSNGSSVSQDATDTSESASQLRTPGQGMPALGLHFSPSQSDASVSPGLSFTHVEASSYFEGLPYDDDTDTADKVQSLHLKSNADEATGIALTNSEPPTPNLNDERDSETPLADAQDTAERDTVSDANSSAGATTTSAKTCAETNESPTAVAQESLPMMFVPDNHQGSAVSGISPTDAAAPRDGPTPQATPSAPPSPLPLTDEQQALLDAATEPLRIRTQTLPAERSQEDSFEFATRDRSRSETEGADFFSLALKNMSLNSAPQTPSEMPAVIVSPTTADSDIAQLSAELVAAAGETMASDLRMSSSRPGSSQSDPVMQAPDIQRPKSAPHEHTDTLPEDLEHPQVQSPEQLEPAPLAQAPAQPVPLAHAMSLTEHTPTSSQTSPQEQSKVSSEPLQQPPSQALSQNPSQVPVHDSPHASPKRNGSRSRAQSSSDADSSVALTNSLYEGQDPPHRNILKQSKSSGILGAVASQAQKKAAQMKQKSTENVHRSDYDMPVTPASSRRHREDDRRPTPSTSTGDLRLAALDTPGPSPLTTRRSFYRAGRNKSQPTLNIADDREFLQALESVRVHHRERIAMKSQTRRKASMPNLHHRAQTSRAPPMPRRSSIGPQSAPVDDTLDMSGFVDVDQVCSDSDDESESSYDNSADMSNDLGVGCASGMMQEAPFTNDDDWKQEVKALFLIRELVQTERSYAQHMESLLILVLKWTGTATTSKRMQTNVLMPSQSHSSTPVRVSTGIAPQHLVTLRAMLPQLISVSRALVYRIEETPSSVGVGQAFIAIRGKFEEVHLSWSSTVGETLAALRATEGTKSKSRGRLGLVPVLDPPVPPTAASQLGASPGHSATLDRREKRHYPKALSAVDVAIMPTQRLARYTLLLRDLLRYTTPDTESYTTLSTALHNVQELGYRCDSASAKTV